MKPSIKKIWIKALTSGKYRQGKGCLKKGEKTFCCLGVLSDLYAKKKKVKWEKEGKDFLLFNEAGVLPFKVKEWAGIDQTNPCVETTKDLQDKGHGNKNSLAHLNDRGCTFKQIAKCIEKSL